MTTDCFRFDRFTLDAADRRLRRDGEPVELNARYLDALCLLVGDALTARQYLEIAREASETISDPRGSEHYRQLGVAYFQLGEDELARSFFGKAPEAMNAKSEAENVAHLLMTSKRH